MPKDCNSPISSPISGGEKQKILPIYSISPFTLLDFPEHTACIIWFSGCNMRCGYCHNPQIVKGKGRGDINQVLNFLEKRKGLLDGVVLSGGESSVYAGLPDFARKVKKMGYAVKLDTNGTRPDIIKDFLEDDLLDYVALDYKAPPEKFKKVTGINKFQDFEKTLSLLCDQKKLPFEVRTTVHTDLMNETDISAIIHDLDNKGYSGTFYVQNFCSDNDRPTLGFLKNQVRLLDISQLAIPSHFKIDFRNF
ncbi:MAG: anaerobic ribonucleoside-triphosphate reductase activating protein [Alphaproteobacteria bacterium]